MPNNNSYPNRALRMSSTSSANSAIHESTSMSMSPRSSSPVLNCTIQYKTAQENESKGIWDGYQTREEFICMHLR